MVVGLDHGPTWLGRDMDAAAAAFTTYLEPDQVVPVPEDLVQQKNKHPAQFMAEWMLSKGLDNQCIAYESDVYYLTLAAVEHLTTRVSNSTWVDSESLVNWERLVKSAPDWGMEVSETIHVRKNDAVCLTQFPREVHLVDC